MEYNSPKQLDTGSDRWRVLLAATHAVLLVLCLSFTWLATIADGKCYVKPCMAGEGLQEIWKVNKGVGFTAIAAGVLSTATAAGGVVLFGALKHDPAASGAHVAIGCFIGVTLVAAMVMLDQVCVWAAEWNLLGDLSLLSPTNEVFYESGRKMHVRTGLITLFKVLAFLSGAACMVQITVVAQLVAALGPVTQHLRLRGGGSPLEEKRPLFGGSA